MFKHISIFGSLILTAMLTALPALAQVSVNCPAQSLQAAINAMTPSGVNIVNVSGTCEEAINILGFQNLLIRGTGGATIRPPSIGNGDPSPAAMSVSLGSNVRLCGLTLDGARTGLSIFESHVQAGNYCGTGNNSLKVMNADTGIALTENSVFLSNSSDGLIVENSAVRGIYVNASRLHLQGYVSGTASTTKIRNNGTDTNAPVRVRGGIWAGEGSTVFLYRVDVRDNGSAGIVGTLGSVVHIYASNVAGNAGWGMLLSNNSTGQIVVNSDPAAPVTSVSSNAGGGILVTQKSSLRLINAPIVSGNAGGNLVCSVSGEAFGVSTNIPNIKKDCKAFTTVADDPISTPPDIE